MAKEVKEIAEEEVVALVSGVCPRCGAYHDDENDIADDHCEHCEDWVECEHCGEWSSPDDMTTVDDEEWCEKCTSHSAHNCDRCGATVAETNTVIGRRGNEVEWCNSCHSNYSFHCDHCDNDFDCDQTSSTDHNGETYCNNCFDEQWFYCDSCEEYHRREDGCDHHCDHIAGYGAHGSFRTKNDRALKLMPCFGAEMEIGDFASASDRNNAMDEFMENIGHDFAYPTSDSSLGDNGVEMITHPVGTMDWLFDDRLSMFMDIMTEHNADCSTGTNAGCHLTTDKFVFSGPEAIKAMVAVVSRFRKVLLLAGDDKGRGSYCLGVEIDEDPITEARRIGKYSCVNLKSKLVEVRVPGMMLDRDRFVAQMQMYANCIDWCNKVSSYKEAGSAKFEDVFLPVLHQKTLSEVISKAQSVPEIKYVTLHGFLQLDTVIPLDCQGSILGVDVIVIGNSIVTDPDHDLYRLIGGDTVEVGNIIEHAGVVGIATVPASNFKGSIFKPRTGNTSNRVFGYGFEASRNRRELKINFHPGYSTDTKLRRIDWVRFVDCERMEPVVAIDPSAEAPRYLSVCDRVFIYDTYPYRAASAFKKAEIGQYGIDLHTGMIAYNNGNVHGDELFMPVAEYTSSRITVTAVDGGFNVKLNSEGEIEIFFPVVTTTAEGI